MKIDRFDILYILLIPFIGLFLVLFYLFLGIMTVLVMSYGALAWSYEFIRRTDFGFDRDYVRKK